MSWDLRLYAKHRRFALRLTESTFFTVSMMADVCKVLKTIASSVKFH